MLSLDAVHQRELLDVVKLLHEALNCGEHHDEELRRVGHRGVELHDGVLQALLRDVISRGLSAHGQINAQEGVHEHMNTRVHEMGDRTPQLVHEMSPLDERRTRHEGNLQTHACHGRDRGQSLFYR